MDQKRFDFDSMLMYGWVADRDLKVRAVNFSLENWLTTHEEYNPGVLRKIGSQDGLDLGEFLKIVLKHSVQLREEVVRRLLSIPELINQSPLSPDKPYSDHGVEINTEIRETKHTMLAGVRCVAVEGFEMASDDVEDRVDLITVCHIKRVDDKWRVTGYQGQLQSAWLRIEPIVREGTKSGAVALMGRNLSHNIGSHALYWLEQDSRGNESLVRFYRYLRERMELLAGFATSVPLSPRSVEFETLISGFKENKILTDRLCKSEGVTSINVETEEEQHRYRIAIPGGTIGMQAFFSILENIIRDRAKYGPSAGTMTLHVSLEELSGAQQDDYLKVVVREQETEDAKRSLEVITNSLHDLVIADEGGHLKEGYWGIKERFIAAALLRGIRVENIGCTETTGGKRHTNWNLARQQPGELPILRVVCVGNSLAWEFYVLRMKEVLVIADDLHGFPGREGVNVRSMEWLEKNLGSPSSVRHRFMVLKLEKQEHVAWIEKNRQSLPARTFMVNSPRILSGNSTQTFVTVEEEALTRLQFDADYLYRMWLQSLDANLDERYIALKGAAIKHRIRWNTDQLEAMSDEDFRASFQDENCIGAIDRHWEYYKYPKHARMHYETYSGSEHVLSQSDEMALSIRTKCALFEAALVRILLVDERLDAASQVAIKETELLFRRADQTSMVCTVKQRFGLKGIDIHGSEYSGESIPPDKETLIRWATEKGKNYYHFICVHRGILDKLHRIHRQGVDAVCAELRQFAPNVLVHSGRAGSANLPLGVKFLPLSNVIAWIDGAHNKMDIMDELCLVRRTE